MNICTRLTALSSLLLISSCGGPSKEARTANVLQTIMASVVEGYLLKDAAEAPNIDCSKGGSITYGDATFSLTTGTVPIEFHDCKIDACGQTVTLDGTTTTNIRMTAATAAEIITGGLDAGEQAIELQIEASNQEMTGFIEGDIDFAYTMKVIGSSSSIRAFVIENTSGKDPLELDGKTYNGEDLQSLASGC
jgi:hypothetical protein